MATQDSNTLFCSVCNQHKTREHFARSTNSNGKRCIPCNKEYMRAYYEKNKPELLKKFKEYKNIPEVRERYLKYWREYWHKNNPPKPKLSEEELKRLAEERKIRARALDLKWKKENPHKIREWVRRYRASDRGKAVERARNERNRKKVAEQARARRKESPDKYRALGAHFAALRRAVVRRAMPSWADLDAIRWTYLNAQACKLTVDHIVPLKGKTVCGLHVHNNLRIISKSENCKKRHLHWPDMP